MVLGGGRGVLLGLCWNSKVASVRVFGYLGFDENVSFWGCMIRMKSLMWIAQYMMASKRVWDILYDILGVHRFCEVVLLKARIQLKRCYEVVHFA